MSRHHEHEHDHDHDHHDHDEALLPVTEGGKTYWRSLDQVEGTKEAQDFLRREFPEGASELLDPVSRRSFLSLMGASVALAGLTGCRRPVEKIVPLSRRPEDTLPGLPQFYATTMAVSGMVTGLVVEAHDGRPTKIEGNRLHPASLGGACSFEQGAVLGLYDPDRTVRVLEGGVDSTWTSYDVFWNERLAELRKNDGRGLLVLHEASTSPAFAAMVAKLRAALPEATIAEWDPIGDDETVAASRLAFGEALQPVYRLEHADSIVAVDADLFGSSAFHLRYSRDWAARRQPDAPGGMNRLWAIEPVFTVTGGTADHRLRVRAGEVGPFLRALAAELQKNGVDVPAGIAAPSDAFPQKFVKALARELAAKRGRSVVAVGAHQPAGIQAIGFAINEALGNVGETVSYAPVANAPDQRRVVQLSAAAKSLEAGQVDTLVILGGNPAYDAPVELGFSAAMAKAKHKIHLAVAPNETSQLADWTIPETHFLEEWGDAVALDGTYSVVQPLVAPLWDGRSKIEILAQIAGAPKKGFDIVHGAFLAEKGTEADWRKALHDGVVEGNQLRSATVDGAAIAGAVRTIVAPPAASPGSLDLVFVADNKVLDGRFANNGWLQELPDPMTKLTWSNAAMVSPDTAKVLGLETNEMVRIEVGGRTLDAGVWVQPGLAENTVAIALGYGRTHAGRVGNGRGFDSYKLRTADTLWSATGAKVGRIAGTALLPTTQNHQSMEGRPLVREGTVSEYTENPAFARQMVKHPPLLALWKQHEYVGQQWGLAIDLNSCVGCNGCMIACQAENNIPVVGPEQVRMGRQMHWIRIDRYFASTNAENDRDLSEPQVVHQPVTCMQCENAPCENVCPVAATVHSKDGGLNDMVYNRCIGTRYCSNNCPYKVRRFNFFDYHHVGGEGEITAVRELAFNPDVTVRTRGVMEKCTYCIQRINVGKRDAKLRGQEKVPDGAITPACAQACPTEAITFGDINDPNSRVSKLKAQPRNYEMLGELNVQPRTSYLARIRNPNPEMAS
ncbi:TAT-variant-translocated molybdopterin oxidoreductase [Vulgatibacter incomptus]|uniref:Molybdopterin oxidoreductase, iron-sulfur binding subunit n=1 Tax=Vulgatibacter incomptus TaxID=1391653 RepID=A0A0K1PI77_9BACT|nr:TAT-variant-translocated molybdopterin oxidoreductase [Vulgatibacter incomptus]AKU92814.1 Molybdopterin oxidoreductase, iron-sulfur binding subunit [Vulgatibacter incomptus]